MTAYGPDGALERVVFLSASIPDPTRWQGGFDPFAITDAVVAAARAIFTRGGIVLTAAHPTIAPLILQVADDFPGRAQGTMVLLYQSDLFQDVIPSATAEMMEREYVDVEWTPAAPGERPQPGSWARSLETMRNRMMTEVPIAAAVFIGGMEGILDEYQLVAGTHPNAARIPVGRPGGEAATLSATTASSSLLASSDLYPWVMDVAMNEVLGPPSP